MEAVLVTETERGCYSAIRREKSSFVVTHLSEKIVYLVYYSYCVTNVKPHDPSRTNASG